jgi:hypothetical protein
VPGVLGRDLAEMLLAEDQHVVGAENLCHLGRRRRSAVGAVQRSASAEPVLACQAWDDFRFVGLKLIFLVAFRAVSVLNLSRRQSWWKDAEILMLRHQLSICWSSPPR